MTPLIVERLRLEVPRLRLVGGAAQLARARDGVTTLPAAFVLPAAETGEGNQFGNQIVQQRVTGDFVVLLAVRNLADGEGAAALESLKPVRDAVREALLGWQPRADADNLEFVRGDLIDFPDDLLWWGDTYRTAFDIRSA